MRVAMLVKFAAVSYQLLDIILDKLALPYIVVHWRPSIE